MADNLKISELAVWTLMGVFLIECGVMGENVSKGDRGSPGPPAPSGAR